MSEQIGTRVELRRLRYAEAVEPPCAECGQAYCCRWAQLQDFVIETFADLDYAVYLSNFDRIDLTLARSGTWSAYYRQDCRNLDRKTMLCRVHGTADQPHACVQYNPFTCHYRPVFGEGQAEEMLRIDRRRMSAILTGLAVDGRRERVALPPFDLLKRAFEVLPIVEGEALPAPVPVPVPVPVADPARSRSEREPLAFGDPAVSTPCDVCQAYCCTRVVMPIEPPADAGRVDYLRYILGFPGTEVVVGDGGVWQLALETTCRHLEGNRCGAFGKPERPVHCQYFDSWLCTYRDTFGRPKPDGDVRLRYEDLPALLDAFTFDDRGGVLSLPDAAALREAVASRR